MLNRLQAPAIQEISNLTFPNYQKIDLANGIPLYIVNMGTQNVFKVEVIFNAGRRMEHKRQVANTTAKLLKEGANNKSSAEIAEHIDFYGGTIGQSHSLEIPSLVLYGMNKHFDRLLPVFADVISNPTFPEEEFQKYIKEKKQQLPINLSKSDIVAYRTITESIFGEDHPYGYNSSIAIYDDLNREDLIQHFQTNYIDQHCIIIASGKIDQHIIQKINDDLAPRILSGTKRELPYPATIPKVQSTFIEKPNSVQSALRLGRKLFNRHHPDFFGMYMLNTIFGGYFGSRLMMNIRENKGYTYNIYSMIEPMIVDGSCIIGTEIGTEYVNATLKEIHHEMDRLCTELVSEKELQMVRNYLKGTMLNWIDGAFNVAEVVKTLAVNELDEAYFKGLVDTINNISPKEIRQLAQRYLDPADWHQVIVGQKT